MKKSFLVAVGILAVVPPVRGMSVASATEMPEGTIEFATTFLFDHSSYSADGTDAGSTTQINLEGSFGYCVSEMIELVGSLALVHQSYDSPGQASADATAYGGGGALVLNFPTQGSLVPFLEVGASLLAYSGDGADDLETTWVLPTAGVGVRFLVTESAALTSGVFYRHLNNALGAEDLSANSISLGVGISILLR